MLNKCLVLAAVSSLPLIASPLSRADQLIASAGSAGPLTGSTQETSSSGLGDLLKSSVLDKVYLNYFGVFHGESFSNFSSAYSVDRTGASSARSAVNFDSEITAAYMITPTIGVGPDIPFLFVPVMGQGFIIGDVGVKAFDTKTISYKGFSLYTNLILQAPTSTGSQARNETLGIKMTPYVRYSFAGTRWTIGSWTEEKAYLGVTTDKTFKLYAEPYVNYRLTSNLSLNLGYELEAHHNVGDTGMLNFTMYQSDLQPGVVWMITPKILFNPYVQIFTTNSAPVADRTALGAVISATVL